MESENITKFFSLCVGVRTGRSQKSGTAVVRTTEVYHYTV